jgi:hypothetical protein
MECAQCGAEINESEAMEARDQKVCEDCYIDLAAKPKACDPWAVYSAKNLSQTNFVVNDRQADIMDYLEKNGPTPPDKLAGDLNMRMDDFEREMAPLRHMEKVGAKLENGRKVICLWQQ